MRPRLHYLLLVAVISVTALLGCTQSPAAPAPTNVPAPPTKVPATVPVQPTAAAGAQPTAASAAKAVDFPVKGKTVTILVGYTAGGGTDVSARLIASPLEKILGTSVQVVNKPGASSQLAITDLVQAKPDGYTLLFATIPTAITTYLDPERKAIYKRKDIQTVASNLPMPTVIAVPTSSPFKTMKDVIDAAKANPKTIKAGTAGLTTTAHLGLLQVEKAANIQFAPVHFEGGGPNVTALLGGHLDVSFASVSEVLAGLKNGQVRVLATMHKSENKFLPGAKTLESEGYKLYSASTSGMIAPAGTPKDVVNVIAEGIKKVTEAADYRAKIEELGYEPGYMGPQEFSDYWDEVEASVVPLMDLAKQK